MNHETPRCDCGTGPEIRHAAFHTPNCAYGLWRREQDLRLKRDAAKAKAVSK